MKRNRSHGKIASLPPELRNAVDEMLKATTFTYEDIKKYLQENGVSVSESAICRYAQNLCADLEAIRIAQENFKALMAEAEKCPELDTTAVLTRIASHRMLNALVSKPEDEWSEMRVDKLLQEINGMTRAVAYKERLAQQNKDDVTAALDEVQAQVFAALATERPELYEQVARWLSKKKQEGLQ